MKRRDFFQTYTEETDRAAELSRLCQIRHTYTKWTLYTISWPHTVTR